MIKTFKYKAVVSKTTAAHAEQVLWRCQQLYNHCLEQRIMVYKQHKVTLSSVYQSNQLPDFKEGFPEWKDVGSQVLQDVVERVDKAYKKFFARVKKGEAKAGFPRFKSIRRYHSFTLKQAGWKLEGRYLKVAKVGTFKLRLSRPIEGKIKTVTIRRDSCGDWFVSFACEIAEPKKWPEPRKEKVGIDVGLKSFCVDSDPDSTLVENPRFYVKSQTKLRQKARKVSRRKKGSARRRKAVKLLAKQYRKVSDTRADFLHKVATHYVRQYQEIHVEALKVSNMVRNKHLSKAISDAGWGAFFELLTYKAEEAGRQLVKVNPRGTSQKCSGCGEVVPKTLAVRVHNCKHCGLSLDRDENAARNIEAGV